MTDYAKGLVKMHDKNGNMMLEAEERKELRGRAAEADLNKDGVITIDELVAHSGSSSTSTASTTPAAASSTSTARARRAAVLPEVLAAKGTTNRTPAQTE